MLKKIKIKIPATSANLGSGYDSIGLALKLYNVFEVAPSSKTSCVIESSDPGVKLNSKTNGFFKAFNYLFRKRKLLSPKISVKIKINIPLACGLGSSATAYLAGLVAANEFLTRKFSVDEILQAGAFLEGHPDNIYPAYFGGAVLIGDYKKNEREKIKVNLNAVITIPQTKNKTYTAAARLSLPDKISRKDCVYNLGKYGLLIHALLSNKRENLKFALNDKIHQRERALNIPLFNDIKELTLKEGAWGTAVSGSGSAVITFAEKKICPRIKTKIENMYKTKRKKCRVYILAADNTGLRLAKT